MGEKFLEIKLSYISLLAAFSLVSGTGKQRAFKCLQTLQIHVRYYFSAGACTEAVWKGGGRVEHRGDLLHPPLRLPALLRRERCKPICSDTQRLLLNVLILQYL